MHYQVNGLPTAPEARQADEWDRLRRYAGRVVVQFVTVAGSYKPMRVRLTLLTVPDTVADPTARALAALCETDAAVQASQAVRERDEWKHHALLLPADPAALALDGALLDGWSSACLTVVYGHERAAAVVSCCPEDRERLDRLAPSGWELRNLPALPPQLRVSGAALLGRRWTGVPSLTPVPGAAPAARPTAPAAVAVPETGETVLVAPGGTALDGAAALTEEATGLILGVRRGGAAVRLARRAQTLALNAPAAATGAAVLALLMRATQAGLGCVLAVERTLLPLPLLTQWDARVRWLDIQRPQDSATLRWREAAPDLLAGALGAEPARLVAPLPAQFATLLDQFGLSELRIAPLLSLTAPGGDDLRAVLAAGGVLVVPQDGDVASALVARLLLAALATPPALGCGLLLLLDPALVAPAALAAQAIQAVTRPRADALLQLTADTAGWQLTGPAGEVLADLQTDLLTDASGDRPDLIQTVLRGLGAPEQPFTPPEEAAPVQRQADAELAPRAASAGLEAAGEADVSEEPDVFVDAAMPNPHDGALDALLHVLLAFPTTVEAEAQVQVCAEDENWTLVDTAVRAWLAQEPQAAHAWAWQVVLLEDDAERRAVARQALALGLAPTIAQAVTAVLDILEPRAIDEVQIGTAMEAALAEAEQGDLVLPVLPPEATDPRRPEVPAASELADLPGEAAEREAETLEAIHATPELPPALLSDPAAADDAVGSSEPAPQSLAAAQPEPILPEPMPDLVWLPATAEPEPIQLVAEVLDDDAIVQAWQEGASNADLVARLVAAGVERTEARQRIRAILRTAAELPSTPVVDRQSPIPAPAGSGAASALEPPAAVAPIWECGPEVAPAAPADPVFLTHDPAHPSASALSSEVAATAGADELLTTTAIAALLGCSDGYVRKLISKGTLPAERDARGVNRVLRSTVLAYQQTRAEAVES
ncbi:MAG TPA: excisionase family DNA-binding protein [Roseiflexaceae bacterium]|nr:excisionase family DNA-binding protein [Roseiflexaceae bacterium]